MQGSSSSSGSRGGGRWGLGGGVRRAGSFSTRAGGRCSQGAWSHSCLLMGAGVPRHLHHWHRLSKADPLNITAGCERHEEKQVGEEFRNPDSWNGAYVSFGASQMALVVKNPSASAGEVRDMSLTPGLGRSPGGGNGNPLQHSCLENPMYRGAWWAMVHRVTKSQTRLKQLSIHLHGSTYI